MKMSIFLFSVKQLRYSAVALLIVFSTSTIGQTTSNHGTILVIHSWHDILWDRLWEKGLHDKLSNNYQLVRYDLDAMRSSADQLKKQADKAWDIFQELKPRLVILGDDAALKVMGLRFADTVPVVYLGINNNPRELIGNIIPRNITGVLERPLYERALFQIVDLLPAGTDRVLLLNDSELNGSFVTNLGHIFGGKTIVTIGDVSIELKVATSWEGWQQATLKAKSDGYGAILFDSRYLLFDSKGTYVEPESGVVRWMAENSELPLFNFYEDSIGPGLSCGGWVLSGYGIGSVAADIVLEILEQNKLPEQIYPTYYKRGEYIFSRTQLKKWGVILPKSIKEQAKFVEDTHQFYQFDCKNFPDSICFD